MIREDWLIQIINAALKGGEEILEVYNSDFDVETDTTSYGHCFTAPNIEGFGAAAGATVHENGTVIDL